MNINKKKFIIETLNKEDKFICEVFDNFLVACNKDKVYRKIKVDYNEMILDEFSFNTNYKGNKSHLNYDVKEFTYNELKYYYLSLKPIELISNQEDFELKLKEIDITGNKPTLLLHSCCGPCSSYVLEYLKNYFDITICFYNPNIDTKLEFDLRLDNLKKIINALNIKSKVIVPNYDHQSYLDLIKGYETNQEGENRCYLCYKQRMELVAKEAINKYDYFTTTLSISPYKNCKWLNEIGIELQKQYNVKYLFANFKLNNGYKRSIELSKKYDLYRQDYCGCEFSKR